MTNHKCTLLFTLMATSFLIPLISAASAVFENGYYVGVKLGAQEAMASWDQANHLTSAINVAVDDVEAIVQMNNIGSGQAFHTNLMGNLAFGYAAIHEQFFLAIEASANIAEEQEFEWTQSDHDSSQFVALGFLLDVATTLDTQTQVTLDSDITLDLRPGLLLAKNFLLYGRVGVARNELSIQQNVSSSIDSVLSDGACLAAAVCELVDIQQGSSSEEDNIYGLRAGLGVEYKVTHELGLNVDYVFTDYGNIDTEYEKIHVVQTSPQEAITTTQASSEASVTKNTLTFGFNWYY